MANKQSALKALRQTEKRTARNQAVKGSIAYLRRMFRKAVEDKDVKKATKIAGDVIKALDKAVQNGVMKKNTVARTKSRLMKKLNDISKK